MLKQTEYITNDHTADTRFTPGTLVQPISVREYSESCTSGTDLAHFRMLIHELLSKYIDIGTQEAPLLILDSKYNACMSNTGKYTKHTRHIPRRVHFVRNGDQCKINDIDWCELGLQLSYIETKNLGENDFNPRMKYIMVRLGN